MIKQIALTAVAVLIALVVYEFGKKALGISSYEDEFEQVN
jgi:hypothetical protein